MTAWMEQMLMMELRSGMVLTASCVIDQYAMMLGPVPCKNGQCGELGPVHRR